MVACNTATFYKCNGWINGEDDKTTPDSMMFIKVVLYREMEANETQVSGDMDESSGKGRNEDCVMMIDKISNEHVI